MHEYTGTIIPKLKAQGKSKHILYSSLRHKINVGNIYNMVNDYKTIIILSDDRHFQYLQSQIQYSTYLSV
jgi:hypothetical protein